VLALVLVLMMVLALGWCAAHPDFLFAAERC